MSKADFLKVRESESRLKVRLKVTFIYSNFVYSGILDWWQIKLSTEKKYSHLLIKSFHDTKYCYDDIHCAVSLIP